MMYYRISVVLGAIIVVWLVACCAILLLMLHMLQKFKGAVTLIVSESGTS